MWKLPKACGDMGNIIFDKYKANVLYGNEMAVFVIAQMAISCVYITDGLRTRNYLFAHNLYKNMLTFIKLIILNAVS